jgi:dihydrofolate reductase
MSDSSPPSLAFVVAMARNRVIGADNDLPWHLPEDLKRFKTLTMGKPVIMGRKTFQSIEARLKRPLPGRQNIVISGAGFSYPGVDVYSDIETAIAETRHEFPGSDIMIIGGASIFEQALPLADRIYLTIIDRDISGDARFPDFDMSEWTESARENFEGYSFLTLNRKKSGR